jgi:L-fuculose-phosphate aldolase
MEMKARQFGHILGFATAFIVAAGDRQAGENPWRWAVLIGGRLLLLGFWMSSAETPYREDIIRVCRMVYEKGWVAMNDGNLSIRLDSERILCTPTAVSKGLVEADDLIVCDMSGHRLEGQRECTSEIAMHTTIYEMRPDVRSVVHAHPPVATGFATAGRALDKALLPEVIIQLGAVPLASYGLPGTPAITDPMLPLIPHYDALLLENHGCTTYGPDVWTAFFRMEMVEHFARITLVAELLGGARPLPREEVQKLFEARSRYRVNPRACMLPGMPLVAEDVLASQD